MRFWSSPAILPLIAEEHTSEHARRYYEANPEPVVWWGASVKCASALARLECDGAVETRDLTQALQQLQARKSAWNEIQPLGTVCAAAQRLLRLHTLRAADAFQLLGSRAGCRLSAPGLGICLFGYPTRRRSETREARKRPQAF